VLALCWRRRAVLAGVPAVAGTALAGLAIARELSARAGGLLLLGAVAALLIAIALIGIGSALWRLLESPSAVELPSADRDRRP